MTAADLHRHLLRVGLTLRVQGGNLLVSPKAKLTADLAAEIRDNKGGLLAYLEPPAVVEWLLKSGEVLQSRRPENWLRPGDVLSWRVPPGVAWQSLDLLPEPWGVAEAMAPGFDPFARARVTKLGTCFHCGGVDFWASKLFPDVRRCRRCCPPAAGAEGVNGG